MPGSRKPERRGGAVGETIPRLVLSSRQDGGIWILVFIACWTFLRGLAGQAFGSVTALAEAVSHEERELEYTIGLIIQLDITHHLAV
ncbi:hypothetical protein D5400_03805 [Georhizobium profundi]|uniref:Uncharacterized protein n=1 Tax=Georhizobium profundi TaxID=2341112 RepID=A0A3S9B0P7_9HYPH|nr:hypothetical protein D5400_03805 [Georhizobium profundi]